MIKVTSANTVLVPSQSVNPAVFQQLWLVEHGVFTKQELDGAQKAMFLPVFVNVPSASMDLLIMRERVQFTFKPAEIGANDDFRNRFKLFVEASGISISSIGFNWAFQIIAECNSTTFAKRIKKMFVSDGNPLAKVFEAPDSYVGCLFNLPVEGGRQTIDVRQMESNGTVGPHAACSFNFHFPVSGLEEVHDKMDRVMTYFGIARTQIQELDQILAAQEH